MYAIIETGGKQYWVKPGQDLQVEKLDAKAGDSVELKVLWAANEEGTSADTKAATAAKVTAQVVKHLRGQKVIVYKRRPKKGYERTQGHRQNLTQIKKHGKAVFVSLVLTQKNDKPKRLAVYTKLMVGIEPTTC